MTSPPGSVELRQSPTNALQLPILIAVVILALFISDVARGGTLTILAICVVSTALDLWLAWWLLRRDRAVLVITPDEITWTRGRDPRRVISRVPDSKLSFRMAANGPFGSEHTGYALMLRDEATGKEVFGAAFGRTQIQKACESQGWTFA